MAGAMSDVFSAVVGQEHAVGLLRHHAAHPVHAYLFVGPTGSGTAEGARAFAAALLCANQGCGECDSCRRVLSDSESEVTWVTRHGLNWSVSEFAEAERISRRRPLARFQIVILEDIQLSDGQTGKLLKILEEPPTNAIFILTAENLPESLVTVVSRCVEVPFVALSEEAIVDYLVRDGYATLAARAAAAAAAGDLRRARVLVRDRAFSDRVHLWQSLPDTLNGTHATSARVVKEIFEALDVAVEPLEEIQKEELQRLIDNAKSVGLRTVTGRKDIETRHKREVRRFRIDDLRFGLRSLADVYHQRLIAGLEGMGDKDPRATSQTQAAVTAIELISDTSQRLSVVNEELLLTNLIVHLANV